MKSRLKAVKELEFETSYSQKIYVPKLVESALDLKDGERIIVTLTKKRANFVQDLPETNKYNTTSSHDYDWWRE